MAEYQLDAVSSFLYCKKYLFLKFYTITNNVFVVILHSTYLKLNIYGPHLKIEYCEKNLKPHLV